MVQKKYLTGSEQHELDSKTGERLASRELIPEHDRVSSVLGSLTPEGLIFKRKPSGSTCNEISYGNNDNYNSGDVFFQNDRMRTIGFEDFEQKSPNMRRMQRADVNNKKSHLQGLVVKKPSGKFKGRDATAWAGEVGKAKDTPDFFKRGAGVIQEIKITDGGEKQDLTLAGREGLDSFKLTKNLEQIPEITDPGVMVQEELSQGFLSDTYKEAKANVQLVSTTMKSKFDQTSQSFSNQTNRITSAIH